MPELSYYRRLRLWVGQHPRIERLLLPLRPVVSFARGLRADLYRWFSHACGVPRLLRLIGLMRWLKEQGRENIPRTAPAHGSPQIVMLACSSLAVDPRIERETRALTAAGFRVRIICPAWLPESNAPLALPEWGPNVSFVILPFQATAYKDSCPWIFSPDLLHAAMNESEVWAYHAHDLDTALPALVAAADNGVPCVCDFHEWYSENVTYDTKHGVNRPHPWLKRRLGRMMEKIAIHSASRIITVCDSIAQEMARDYSALCPISVVRNIPPLDRSGAPLIDLRATLGIPADKAVLLYQGGVGPSRGLEPLIRAMGIVQNAVLVIRGPGVESFGDGYLRLANEFGAADRVFCQPPVPSNRCVAEASSADIGFWTLLPICKNFTYALPNKVFEYLAADLPVVCAHHPEVAKIVRGFDVGRCFDPEKPESIAEAVEALARDAALRRRCRANIPRALTELQAEKEWARLVTLYQGLFDEPLNYVSTNPASKAA